MYLLYKYNRSGQLGAGDVIDIQVGRVVGCTVLSVTNVRAVKHSQVIKMAEN